MTRPLRLLHWLGWHPSIFRNETPYSRVIVCNDCGRVVSR